MPVLNSVILTCTSDLFGRRRTLGYQDDVPDPQSQSALPPSMAEPTTVHLQCDNQVRAGCSQHRRSGTKA